ncbi:hypothetical protein ES703_112477 [subsurface metagenome]
MSKQHRNTYDYSIMDVYYTSVTDVCLSLKSLNFISVSPQIYLGNMSQVICGLCGRFFSVKHYDPDKFEDDIKRVQVRGKGRGKGTKREWTKSIFEDENDPIFIKIRDRISTLHSLFFDDEDRSDKQEELLDDVNAALMPYYNHAFENFDDAVKALLVQFLDYEEEEDDESSDVSYHEENDQPMSELDRLIQSEEKWLQRLKEE